MRAASSGPHRTKEVISHQMTTWASGREVGGVSTGAQECPFVFREGESLASGRGKPQLGTAAGLTLPHNRQPCSAHPHPLWPCSAVANSNNVKVCASFHFPHQKCFQRSPGFPISSNSRHSITALFPLYSTQQEQFVSEFLTCS